MFNYCEHDGQRSDVVLRDVSEGCVHEKYALQVHMIKATVQLVVQLSS